MLGRNPDSDRFSVLTESWGHPICVAIRQCNVPRSGNIVGESVADIRFGSSLDGR